MEVNILIEKEDELELELDNKSIANLLRAELIAMGVDAYTYEPHPLLPGYRLHIKAPKARDKFIEAVERADKNWKKLHKMVEEALSPTKKKKGE